jgi:hypothetical protein
MESSWEKIAGLKFQPGSYKDQNGQLRPCYELTKTECLYIATKFNDEARAKTGTHRTDGFGQIQEGARTVVMIVNCHDCH